MNPPTPRKDDPAFRKLENVLGPERARQLIEQICRERNLSSLETPDDRLEFAEGLMAQGGLLEAIGRSIKIQAILHGAQDRKANKQSGT